ncbi:MAG: TatD family hydrolase [Rickettsiales bacterium]|jgi:TatD DNase family protein|nr:TatD family hydrolase [Rickettsiales bacterium]
MLVDSHCHLNSKNLINNLAEVLSNASEAEVKYMLTVCTKIEEFPEILTIAENHQNISCSIGIHPSEADNFSPKDIEFIQKHLTNKKVVAIGETGLDYYYQNSVKAAQKESFAAHINLSQSSHLPIIIHTREAEKDTADMLTSAMKEQSFSGVMHCFTSSYDLAKASLDLGMYISISGIVTFKNADDLRETVKKIPLDRLLIETDSPYLAPIPKRGKTNEPAFVKYVAEFLANYLNMDYEEFCEITSNNLFRLFNKIQQ